VPPRPGAAAALGRAGAAAAVRSWRSRSAVCSRSAAVRAAAACAAASAAARRESVWASAAGAACGKTLVQACTSCQWEKRTMHPQRSTCSAQFMLRRR